jgi:hypothetical protein
LPHIGLLTILSSKDILKFIPYRHLLRFIKHHLLLLIEMLN